MSRPLGGIIGMQQSGGCQALPFQPMPLSMPLPNIYLRDLVSSKLDLSNPIIAASLAAADQAQEHFDFWSEDENARFIWALDSERYPPDYSVIAAKVGSKSPEQCTSYTHLYFEALAHRRRLDQSQERPGGLHLTATEVYTHHGVGVFYKEYEKAKAKAAVAKSEGVRDDLADRDATAQGSKEQVHNAASPPLGHAAKSSGVAKGKSSAASLLLGSGDATAAATEGLGRGPASASRVVMPRATAAAAQSAGGAAAEGGVRRSPKGGKAKGGGSGSVESEGGKRMSGGGALAGSKRRREPSMEEVESDIESRRVPHEKLWEYSAMEEAAPEVDGIVGRRNKGKNPWLWSRKAICKITGYCQWWPLFAEHVHLSERDAKDDLKKIRTKAPPPTVAELCNPYSRKFDKIVAAAAAAKKKGGAEEALASAGKVIKGKLQVGDFVEVKWGVDWWHAQVIKLGKTNRANKIMVGYVGGTEDEEEWVEISKVRAPLEDVRHVLPGKGGMR